MSAASGTSLMGCAGLEDPATGGAGAVVVNVENRSSRAGILPAEREPDRQGRDHSVATAAPNSTAAANR